MLFVDNESVTDPALNLAIEEHLLRRLATDEDVLLFYVNEPSIIIGRNQNTLEEINTQYVEANGVHVVRRLSGGGAVYHDLGNLNFSFIAQHTEENIHNFRKFTAPVIRVLRELGVPAELSGRNDIVADGRKISGNAQYVAAQRMLSHGTLLLDSDLARVARALRVRPGTIESRAIASVRSPVANIREFLAQPMDVAALRARLLQGIFEGAARVPQYQLSGTDWEAIGRQADERYRSWDWNYGRSPAFSVRKVRRFATGELAARIDVDRGLIRSIKVEGDVFGQGEPDELERRLIGVRYDRAAIARALCGAGAPLDLAGVTCAHLVECLY